jgi:hypothetical protein
MPRENDLQATDTVRETGADEAGRLDNEVFVNAVNGEIASQILVERLAKTGKYKYQGTYSGKPISGEFVTSEGLSSEVLQGVLIRRDLMGAKPGARVEVDEYVGSVNPAGAVRTVYSREAGTTAVISATSQGLKYSFVPDENGWPKRSEIPIGAATMTYERGWSHGAP